MPSIMQFLLSLFKQHYYGVYPASVIDIEDPDNLGRVRLSVPILGSGAQGSMWARIATLMAGSKRGTWFIPEVEDEVLVAFERGDPRQPYVVGALWNAQNPPPEQVDASGVNLLKSIHTRNGIVVSLHDRTGEEAIVLETPGGQSLVLQDGKDGSVEITDSSGNQIRLSPTGAQIVASAKTTINTSILDVSASSVQVNAGMTRFSGTVQVDTLIATSVISANYSPGAGNVS